MTTTVSRPTLYVNITNNCQNGYITFNGFPDTWKPDPVQHGGPPVIMPAIKNDGDVHTALMVSSSAGAIVDSDETQGEAYFNMPNGSLLTVSWYLHEHTFSNPDEGKLSISCAGYSIEYLQADGVTYSPDVYWTVTDVNTFTCYVQITE